MNDPVAGCSWSAKIEHDGIVARNPGPSGLLVFSASIPRRRPPLNRSVSSFLRLWYEQFLARPGFEPLLLKERLMFVSHYHNFITFVTVAGRPSGPKQKPLQELAEACASRTHH
jgi:hypothetical protein